jgi:hypothetical protein
MLKAVRKLGIEETYITNWNHLSKISSKKRMSLSPLFFNIALKLLSRAIKQEKEIRKGRNQIIPIYWRHDLKRPKKLHQKTPRHHKHFQ